MDNESKQAAPPAGSSLTAAPSAASSPQPAPRNQQFVVIEKRWRNHAADTVHQANDELIALLKADGVPYHEATDFERHVGGFPDTI